MRSILFSFLFLLTSVSVLAEKPAYDVLATGSQRVVLFTNDFAVKWEFPAGNIHEVHLLPNGNILFADEGVTEVTQEKKVVFRYTPPEGKYGSCTCQRLANGNTLIGENFSGLIKELTPDGTVAFELLTRYKTDDLHHRMRVVRKLENGHYLVCHSGDHLVREYTPKGETVWEYPTSNIAFCAERLENGNTMVSSLGQITEVAPDGKTVWEFKASELPQLGIRSMTGFQILRNGNIVIGCYDAYDSEGKGVGLFEITREKKLVWAYQKRTDRSMMGVEVREPADIKTVRIAVTKEGKPVAGATVAVTASPLRQIERNNIARREETLHATITVEGKPLVGAAVEFRTRSGVLGIYQTNEKGECETTAAIEMMSKTPQEEAAFSTLISKDGQPGIYRTNGWGEVDLRTGQAETK